MDYTEEYHKQKERADALENDLETAQLHLDLANKAILAHLDAAGGQEGGKEAGVTLGSDIVVAVLRHRKARAEKAEAEVERLKGQLATATKAVLDQSHYANQREAKMAALEKALREIAEDAGDDLNPALGGRYTDEWTEAAAFTRAKTTAQAALTALGKPEVVASGKIPNDGKWHDVNVRHDGSSFSVSVDEPRIQWTDHIGTCLNPDCRGCA